MCIQNICCCEDGWMLASYIALPGSTYYSSSLANIYAYRRLISVVSLSTYQYYKLLKREREGVLYFDILIIDYFISKLKI